MPKAKICPTLSCRHCDYSFNKLQDGNLEKGIITNPRPLEMARMKVMFIGTRSVSEA